MRQKIVLLIVFLATALVTGQSVKKGIDKKSEASELLSFGEKFDNSDVISTQEMSVKYGTMAVADSTKVKFTAVVTNVCKVKGCWMKVQLEDGKETMVRFKDYGFFVPKDIIGKEVVVGGLAFVEEMSIVDQKHYAKDAGKSDSEIAKITSVKTSLGFEATGVLLKE